ncbi:MAG: uroporphyrinogen-III C-methyltransferase [Chloroflexia bacterium]|nr:uroporphyrinogen-III C-methyltransferase [Chloroflexia bacterium]
MYITGFGPGDPELLTIKAIKAIEKADVIFFDDLIDHKFLKNYQAEKIYVGKRKGNHSYSQEEINEFLYRSAVEVKITVRLKGGDPFIFGRGGEEYEFLKERNVDVEVIPGITAAFGAAATSGISLTSRGISSSVAFCTGFPESNKKIPEADTLVFYMSASNLKQTAITLILEGRDAGTPVALVRNATLNSQETVITTLLEISEGKVKLASPMVAIIGDVVGVNNKAVSSQGFEEQKEAFLPYVIQAIAGY